MLSTTDEITKLNLTSNLLKKLHNNNIKIVNDLWILKRKQLKEIGLNDKEIKSIVISLQLEGLDLNKKIYN